ncbi:MAG TPA: hypothetical protein VF557_17535 [Jatrophihabitans sp.]|uniref:hypothetical protein n=1 Tax=Jatrophihabitans sp. TaxID=1932789 RepID=UPI002EF45E8E
MSGRPGKLTLLQPKWLLLHLVTLAVCGGMIWLGYWQWRAAVRRNDDLRNYAYALQWWAFVGFTVLMWFRIVHDHLRPDRHANRSQDVSAQDVSAHGGGAREADAGKVSAQNGGARDAGAPDGVTPDGRARQAGAQQQAANRYRGYTPPPPPDPELETDPERRRLNAYLARLSAADREAAE